jgi:hypothetical protein
MADFEDPLPFLVKSVFAPVLLLCGIVGQPVRRLIRNVFLRLVHEMLVPFFEELLAKKCRTMKCLIHGAVGPMDRTA